MIFDSTDMMAWRVTLKLAVITTIILLMLGAPIAWGLSRMRWRYKFVLEALIALPLVLPPTVLGFYLLLTLGPNGPIGQFLQWLGLDALAFTFSGLVVGSVLFSFPFVVQPLQNAFIALGRRPLEAAATLGASRWDQFWSIVVPMTRPAFLTAAVLGFAHTVGEFGVVLMIGGNIPGETQVLSIAIYEHVEVLEYENAHWLAGGLLLLSFSVLSVVYGLNRRFRGGWI